MAFIAWNWDRFGDASAADLLRIFLNGLRFDLWAVVALSIPGFLLFLHRPRGRRAVGIYLVLFIVLQLPLLLINVIDVEYVNFTGHRLVKESWIIVREASGKLATFAQTDAALTGVGLALGAGWAIALIVLTRRMLSRSTAAPAPGLRARAGVLLAVLPLLFLAVRGGWQSKPLNYAHAELFQDPYRNLAVTNSTFTLIESLFQSTFVRYHDFDDPAAMTPLLNGARQADRSQLPDLKGFNVVVIIVESLTTQYTALGGLGESWTPFLDSLAAKSVAFPNHFANGRRSITGLTAILAGIPDWMGPEAFISSEFASTQCRGLGASLKRAGYSTAFFHGGENGTMYLDVLAQKTGFDRYYGAREYPSPADHDGTWGIWDEAFLAWSLDRIDALPAPFGAAIFTLSSHHPFKVPAAYSGRFRRGPLPILEALGYTDLALSEFFSKARTKPWFDRTLFVIVGDHTFVPLVPGSDPQVERFRVPLLLYAPGHLVPRRDPKAIQHVDIIPSILDLLRVDAREPNALGVSVFAPGPETVINEDNGQFWARYAGQRAAWSAARGFAGDTEAVRRMQAHLQYFTDGLWNGRFYPAPVTPPAP